MSGKTGLPAAKTKRVTLDLFCSVARRGRAGGRAGCHESEHAALGLRWTCAVALQAREQRCGAQCSQEHCGRGWLDRFEERLPPAKCRLSSLEQVCDEAHVREVVQAWGLHGGVRALQKIGESKRQWVGGWGGQG